MAALPTRGVLVNTTATTSTFYPQYTETGVTVPNLPDIENQSTQPVLNGFVRITYRIFDPEVYLYWYDSTGSLTDQVVTTRTAFPTDSLDGAGETTGGWLVVTGSQALYAVKRDGSASVSVDVGFAVRKVLAVPYRSDVVAVGQNSFAVWDPDTGSVSVYPHDATFTVFSNALRMENGDVVVAGAINGYSNTLVVRYTVGGVGIFSTQISGVPLFQYFGLDSSVFAATYDTGDTIVQGVDLETGAPLATVAVSEANALALRILRIRVVGNGHAVLWGRDGVSVDRVYFANLTGAAGLTDTGVDVGANASGASGDNSGIVLFFTTLIADPAAGTLTATGTLTPVLPSASLSAYKFTPALAGAPTIPVFWTAFIQTREVV
jgi:hypothetical protein